MQFKKKSAAVAIAALVSGVSFQTSANTGYEIVEVGTLPSAFSSVGRDINDSGVVAGFGYDLLNLLIRTDLLDPESEVFDGIDDLTNLSSSEYRYVRDYLSSPNGVLSNSLFQKVGITEGFVFDGSFLSLNEAFDVIEPNTGTLTQSNSFYPQSIDNSGNSIGTVQSPFLEELGQTSEGDEQNYFTPERLQSAYWSNGSALTYLTGNDDVIFGGVSQAYSINEVGQVVGFASLENRDFLESGYEDCIAEEVENSDGEMVPNDQIPLGACIYQIWSSAEYNSNGRMPLYEERAYLWELDANGNVLNKRSLGKSFEIPEDVAGVVRSAAIDVNVDGVAVGSTEFISGGNTSSFADIYTEEGAQRILPDDTSGYRASHGALINDNGYIVGWAFQFLSTSFRSRMFITTIDGVGVEENITFPSGFFADSSWTPNDLNNQNQIVGRAEREQLQSQRRTVGFVYDIETDTINDLNDLIPCDSGYRIIEATAINEQGEILVSAMTEYETTVDGRDYEGESVQTLVLRPSESVSPCTSDADKQERKGASMSPIQLGFLSLLGVIAFITRRRKLKA